LAGYLRELAVTDIFLCGLARDVCVRWTAEDGASAGFRVFFLWDLTRSVDPSRDRRLESELKARGIGIVDSEEIPS
jgi:nicotinamidase/pyrazinamidase